MEPLLGFSSLTETLLPNRLQSKECPCKLVDMWDVSVLPVWSDDIDSVVIVKLNQVDVLYEISVPELEYDWKVWADLTKTFIYVMMGISQICWF